MSATAHPVTKHDYGFPAIMAAALGIGGVVYVIDQFDRRAAMLLAVTLLMGVAVARDIPKRLDEAIKAVSGQQ